MKSFVGDALINALLQRGVHPAKDIWNRFSGFLPFKTVETVETYRL
jgi:hypothetical protein